MTSPFARKKNRKPAAEEIRIKAERHKLILELMSYDSLYHRTGGHIVSSDVAIMLGISTGQAAHALGDMSKHNKLDASKYKTKCRYGSHLANQYKVRQPTLLTKAWRTRSNEFTRLDNYRFIGAVI
jgi:hypothetical protein